jgi:hypothetical protein
MIMVDLFFSWDAYGNLMMAFFYLSRNAIDVLDFLKFKINDCKSAPTLQFGVKLLLGCPSKEVHPTLYKQFVGSLLYLTLSILDICFAVGLVASKI